MQLIDVEPAPAPTVKPAARRPPPRRSIRLHRWTGWVLGIWIVFEALTGSYLAVRDDVQQWIDRGWYHHTAGDVGVDAAIASAESVVAGGRVRFITFPGDGHGVYVLDVATAAGDAYTAYVDPGTGHVNQLSGDHRSIGQLVLELHADFNRTEILGVRTPTILGWLAILWLANLVLGYRASRPHRRTFRQWFRVRRGRGRFTFHLDLHKAIGLAVIVPLLAVVVTGIMFELPRQSRAVVDAVTPGPLNGDDETTFRVPFSTPTATGKRLPVSAVVDTLTAQGVEVDHLRVPIGNPAGTYAATVDVGGYDPYEGPFGGGKTAAVYVDQYSGALLAIDDSRGASIGQQLFTSYKGAVHFGTFGGFVTRVLWSLLGLATAALVVTAALMRTEKLRKRRRRATT